MCLEQIYDQGVAMRGMQSVIDLITVIQNHDGVPEEKQIKMDRSFWRRDAAKSAPTLTKIVCPRPDCKRLIDYDLHAASSSCPFCTHPTRSDASVPRETITRIPAVVWVLKLLEDPTFYDAVVNPASPTANINCTLFFFYSLMPPTLISISIAYFGSRVYCDWYNSRLQDGIVDILYELSGDGFGTCCYFRTCFIPHTGAQL